MIDMRAGRIAYAVRSHGGLLGMGDMLFAVPWRAPPLDLTKRRLPLNVPKGRLKEAPGF